MLALPLHAVDVVLDPTQTYQTIVGWGHGGGILGGTGQPYALLDPAVADPVNYQYLDYLVDDLGLTGTRTWEVGPRVDGTGMDHGDCDAIDWNLFESDTFSPSQAKYLLYYQNRIIAEGYQPNFYSSPGYPTHATDVKPWVMNHPGERAQQLWASALYLKNTYGININYAVLYNEPSIASSILAEDSKAVAPRFVAQGLGARVQYAEAVAPQTDWGYFTPLLTDPDMWPTVGRISYHNYGTADPYRTYLRDFAKAKGLTTAQTEMGNPSFDDLYSDLTLGDVSYWEVGYSSSVTLVPNPGLSSFAPGGRYFRLRQLIHYVRPGAVRIRTVSSDPVIRVLAFKANGATTTLIENTSTSAQTVTLNGIPPGVYGLSRSSGSPFQEVGLQTVGASGTLVLTNVPGSSNVSTLYPYSGPNHPPTIQVWGTSPGYIVAPASTATLSVTASDPEVDPLTYQWSVTSQPAGANAIIATPTSASSSVSGLTVPGTYLFNVNVRDGVNTSSKQVYLVAYAATPPPVLGQIGFRINAPYGLIFGDPSAITHANIELPTSAATLQAGISDIANSDFTGRGQWSVVSQPAGANVTLGSTTYVFVSIRANVSGMTVPGDYVFQVNVTNPGHPDLTAQIKCTVNPASSGPVISSTTASPNTLILPVSSTQLSAVTSAPAGQLLRHWWAVKTTPVGAKPAFDHQGLPTTNVSNLVLPGSYTFTLRAFDDIHETTKDVTLNVSPTAGAPVVNSAATASVMVGAPFTYTITATNSPTSYAATNLPAGLSINPGTNTISGTPAIAGTYNIQISATNATGTGYGNIVLTVKAPLPSFTNSTSADGVINTAFAYTLVATGVTTSFSATDLPSGLVLDSLTGAITGTPTVAGTFPVTTNATNTTGTTAGTLTIVIYNATPSVPVITCALNASGSIGSSFNYSITAANNPTSFFAIGLPAGLSFDQDKGVISGIPSVAGTFNVTIRASNNGGTGAATLTLVIQTPYQAWQSANFTPLQLSNPAVSSDGATPANDGVANLTKYALGLFPFQSYNPGSSGLPLVKIQNFSGTDYLTLAFTGVATDVTYKAQATSNLTGAWTTIQTFGNGSAPSSVTVQDSQPTSASSARFMRLQVTSP